MIKTDLDTFLKFIDHTGEQKHFRTVEIEGLDWIRERKMRKEMSEIQKRVITAVLLERKRQDSKWGEQNHPPHYWTGILGEEYGELCEAINETVFGNWSDKGGFENMRREAIHVAAVAIGFLECLERNKALWFSSPTQGGREREVLGDE